MRTPQFEVWEWNEENKAYDITHHDPVSFTGQQFCPAPSSLADENKIVDDLLEWICMRPGDTDQEYFSEYTSEQLAWANSYTCEMLQSDLMEAND